MLSFWYALEKFTTAIKMLSAFLLPDPKYDSWGTERKINNALIQTLRYELQCGHRGAVLCSELDVPVATSYASSSVASKAEEERLELEPPEPQDCGRLSSIPQAAQKC